MTTPHESIQAMRFAGEFLKKVRDMDDAPALLREEAAAILRHYPNAHQIELQAGLAGLTQTTPGYHPASVEPEFK